MSMNENNDLDFGALNSLKSNTEGQGTTELASSTELWPSREAHQLPVDIVDDDPMVQMTIRCPKSVRERFEAMANGSSRKDKKTYGVMLEILMDSCEET